MVLERMACQECGAEFAADLFADDPSETFVCPLCGTIVLDAIPVEDAVLRAHAGQAPDCEARPSV